MVYRVGDRVRFMDFDCEGTVVSVEGDSLTVFSEGLTMRADISEVVRIDAADSAAECTMYAANSRISGFKPIPVKSGRNGGRTGAKKNSAAGSVLEVDLHAGNIRQHYPAAKNVPDCRILSVQLKLAEDSIEEALRKGIGTVIFIHGNGHGVLRAELEKLLAGYPEVTFREASRLRYGTGAMEVTLKRLSVLCK